MHMRYLFAFVHGGIANRRTVVPLSGVEVMKVIYTLMRSIFEVYFDIQNSSNHNSTGVVTVGRVPFRLLVYDCYSMVILYIYQRIL